MFDLIKELCELTGPSAQEDLVLGTPIANRNQAEIEGLIGFFVNTLALRADLKGDPAFPDLLAQVREATLGAYAHQDLPFEKLVEELKPERDPSYTPIFQTLVVLQNAPLPEIALPGLRLAPVAFDGGTAKFDLTLGLTDAEPGQVVMRCGNEYAAVMIAASPKHRMLFTTDPQERRRLRERAREIQKETVAS